MNWLWLMWGFIAGLVVGYFAVRWLMKRELKNNPPITEAQIRAMYQQMGRTPSQKQVAQVMQSMKAAGAKQTKKKKK